MVQLCVRLPLSDNTKSSDVPEWAIIELQGDLESKSDQPLQETFIGDLHYTKKEIPIFIIGHHIMYGKVVNLEKPLLVLQRNRIDSSQKDPMNPCVTELTNNTDETTDNSNVSLTTEYLVTAVIKKKLLFKTRPKPIVSNIPKKI